MKVNRTVDRAITMLELIAKHPKGMTLNEMIEMMNIPKSSGFDILQTLVNSQMVERIGIDGKYYKIGVKAFGIGNQYINNVKVVDRAKGYLEEIAEKHTKTVFIGQESGGKVVYVYKYQAISPVVATCAVGSQNEFYNTALGRCILAFKEDWLAIIEHFWEDGSIKDKEEFVAEIQKIKREKYAVSNQEHQIQIFCVAVPVFDYQNEVIAAISMSGLYGGEEQCQIEIQDLKEVAAKVSRSMGYMGNYQ